MINLGEFKPGDTVFYAANFHSDAGALVDPSTPTARLRNHAGTWSNLTAPAQQDAKTGFFGGTIDTTGFSAGQHIIRLAGTVATAKDVATVFCFTIVANIASDVMGRLGSPAGASVSADIATVQADLDNPAQYKADVSALATQTSVNAIPTNPVLNDDARLDNLDAAVSTRLATAGYTAPDNAGVALIKALTLSK